MSQNGETVNVYLRRYFQKIADINFFVNVKMKECDKTKECAFKPMQCKKIAHIKKVFYR